MLVDDETIRLDGSQELPALSKVRTIDLVVDRVALDKVGVTRLAEALETAYAHGHGAARVVFHNGDGDRIYLAEPGCLDCDFYLPRLEPRMFSFNSHLGACVECDGLGRLEQCDEDRLIAQPDRPLMEGAGDGQGGRVDDPPRGLRGLGPRSARENLRFRRSLPFRHLPEAARNAILYGEGIEDHRLTVTSRRKTKTSSRVYTYDVEWRGLLAWIEELHRNAAEGWRKRLLARYMVEDDCPECEGGRLKPEFLAVTVEGLNIQDITSLSIDDAWDFFDTLHLTGVKVALGEEVLKEIQNRPRLPA